MRAIRESTRRFLSRNAAFLRQQQWECNYPYSRCFLRHRHQHQMQHHMQQSIRCLATLPTQLQTGAHPEAYASLRSLGIDCTRHFSTTAPPAQAKAETQAKDDAKSDKKKKTDDSNWLLDNLGKIFLAVIAAIIATLIRSSYNTSNRNALRDKIELISALDPCEIADLRIANSELTADVYRQIMTHVYSVHGPTCTYEEFIATARRAMAGIKGDTFTIQLGHYLDRVVVALLDSSPQQPSSAFDDFTVESSLSRPVMLWMTILALTVNSPVPDRIKLLFELLEHDSKNMSQLADMSSPETTQLATIAKVIELVGHLQASNQLPPDTQVISTDVKYPTQQFKRAEPEDLVPWEGNKADPIDLDAFAAILRSKSVCAWGECYQKKTFGASSN